MEILFVQIHCTVALTAQTVELPCIVLSGRATDNFSLSNSKLSALESIFGPQCNKLGGLYYIYIGELLRPTLDVYHKLFNNFLGLRAQLEQTTLVHISPIMMAGESMFTDALHLVCLFCFSITYYQLRAVFHIQNNRYISL